jgi:hypothetical protein
MSIVAIVAVVLARWASFAPNHHVMVFWHTY